MRLCSQLMHVHKPINCPRSKVFSYEQCVYTVCIYECDTNVKLSFVSALLCSQSCTRSGASVAIAVVTYLSLLVEFLNVYYRHMEYSHFSLQVVTETDHQNNE